MRKRSLNFVCWEAANGDPLIALWLAVRAIRQRPELIWQR